MHKGMKNWNGFILTAWLTPHAISWTSTSITGTTWPSRVFSMKTWTFLGCNSQLNVILLLVTKYFPSVLWPVEKHNINTIFNNVSYLPMFIISDQTTTFLLFRKLKLNIVFLLDKLGQTVKLNVFIVSK